MNDAEPRAALLTPAGRGAIATVRVCGAGALQTVARLFIPVGTRTLQAGNRIYFGRWQFPQGEELVITARSAEHVEIHCHGGHAASAAILASLRAAGCLLTCWDAEACTEPISIVGEALLSLAAATTQRAALHLLDQYNGALLASLRAIRTSLQQDDLPASISALDELIECRQVGLHLSRPWRVVIAGQPNAGKSRLMNALLGYDRAIVFDTPGTTRDIVSAQTAIDGWPVEFSDTAGLRDSVDAIERAGIIKAEEQIAGCDLVLLVADVTQSPAPGNEELLARWPDALPVFNKSDLPYPRIDRPRGIVTSAITGEGLGELQAAISRRLIPTAPKDGDAIPFTNRQVELLTAAAAHLRSGGTRMAISALQRIDPALSEMTTTSPSGC